MPGVLAPRRRRCAALWRPQCGRDPGCATALGMLDHQEEDLYFRRAVTPLSCSDAQLDQAVRAFQQHRGLLVGGIVGEATLPRVESLLLASGPKNAKLPPPSLGSTGTASLLQARL